MLSGCAVSTPRESVAEQGAQGAAQPPAAAAEGSSRPPKPKKPSAKRARTAMRNPFSDPPSHESTPAPPSHDVKAEPGAEGGAGQQAATPKKAKGAAKQLRSSATRTPGPRSARWGASTAALGSPVGSTGRRLRSVRFAYPPAALTDSLHQAMDHAPPTRPPLTDSLHGTVCACQYAACSASLM